MSLNLEFLQEVLTSLERRFGSLQETGPDQYSALVNAVAEVQGQWQQMQSAHRTPLLSPRHGTMREQILPLLGGDWTTVADLAAQTGLSEKQVRGVLNAADIRGRVESRGQYRRRQYRLRLGEPAATDSVAANGQEEPDNG